MPSSSLDVAIIGAGFSGLATARALQRAGRTFRVFEQHAAIGGTWRDNVYPGAACDVPSQLYSLAGTAYDWPRVFGRQPEIRAYLEALAAPLLAAGLITTGARLRDAQWRPAAAHWQLCFADGTTARARTLVLALGGLHVPRWADVPGRESFTGLQVHSARWPADVDLQDRRVAVIGSGASAVQLVPAIVERVARLHVVQRTPAWVVPRPDHALPRPLRAALRALPPLRLAWRGASFALLETLCSGLLAPRRAGWARTLALRHLRRQIADPALRARLTPTYPIGCKRVLLSSDFYPALQRAHCELVDAAIERIEPEGLRLADGRLLAVDAIVHATGFDPQGSVRALDIRGRDGLRLADAWRQRAQAHLGIGVHGFPNLFFLLGPNTALGHNSVLYMIERQVRHVLAALAARDARGADALEPRAQAQARWLAELDARFPATAWAGCRSWYLDDEGRNVALWIGSARAYARRARFDARDYAFA